MFDLDADWATIARTLGADRALAAHIGSHAGVRVAGCWSGFELTTESILRQEIGAQGAHALIGRMVRAFGQPLCPANGLTHLFPTPEVLRQADLESIGVSRPKADAIRALARGVHNGQISFDRVLNSDAVLARVREIPGISDSTAAWVEMRALREPDAFPSADRDLARVLALGGPREFEERSLAWRPWRAYAAIYLWSIADEMRRSGNASPPCTA